MGKKKKEVFQEFRKNDKSAYKTLKIPLKTILLNREIIQPVINSLVFEMNDLVICVYKNIKKYKKIGISNVKKFRNSRNSYH